MGFILYWVGMALSKRERYIWRGEIDELPVGIDIIHFSSI